MDEDPTRIALQRLRGILSERFAAAEDQHCTRVVLVIGAGASLESGYRLWGDAELKRALIRAVSPAFGNRAAFVSEARRKLAPYVTLHGGADRRAQEAALVARARTDQLCSVAESLALGREKLIEFLQGQYQPARRGIQPQLAYELIAHLMKHRFVDHVISLNFDEVLDAALNDELGRTGYRLVLPGSSGHHGSRLPHLFKLHGTISDADSLRFALDDVGALEPRTTRLLERVVLGAESKPESVWIVSLGYSWADRDMRAWITRHYEAVAGVICVARDDAPARDLRADLRDEYPGKEPFRVYSLATADAVVRGEDPATVDEVLWAVWKATKDDTPPHERVPSAARHLLISHLFPRPKVRGSAGPLRDWPSVYRRYSRKARIEAEVFLTTGKTDGLVILSSLARDTRIIRHWPEDASGRPALEALTFLRRNAYADVTEVYVFRGNEQDYARYFAGRCGRRLPLSGQRVPELAGVDISVPWLEDGVIRRRPEPYLGLLERYLGKVLNGVSVEVDPGRDERAALLFRGARMLPTYKALTDCTRVVLHSEWASLRTGDRPQAVPRGDWELLLVIAESGKWLQAPDFMEVVKGRRVLLIEASTYALPGWSTRKPPPTLGSEVLTLGVPWWVHNRHLTLAMRRDGQLQAGIYFRRRERTPRIAPVALDHPHDLGELLKIFLSYTARFFEEYAWHRHPRTGIYEQNAEAFYRELTSLPLGRAIRADGRRWVQRLTAAWEMYSRNVQGHPPGPAKVRVPRIVGAPSAAASATPAAAPTA